MLTIGLIRDAEGAWKDLADKKSTILTNVVKAEMAGLKEGMQGGSPSIALRLDLADGQVVIWQTSLKLLLTAADFFKALYGDPRE